MLIGRSPSLLYPAMMLCLMFCATLGWNPVSGQPKVPMPPTNLTVVATPPNVQLVDKIFAREGIPKDARASIYSDLTHLAEGDLIAVTRGIDPSVFEMKKPDGINVESWQKLAQAYAEAIVADHKELRDARRSFWNLLLSVVLSAVLLVPSGMALQIWRDRKRARKPKR
jgi:hypothetical protein